MTLNKSTIALLGTIELKQFIADHFETSLEEVNKWIAELDNAENKLLSEFGLNIIMKYRTQYLKEWHIRKTSDLFDSKTLNPKKKYRWDTTGRKHKLNSMTGKKTLKKGSNF